jgi:hypothetical protein
MKSQIATFPKYKIKMKQTAQKELDEIPAGMRNDARFVNIFLDSLFTAEELMKYSATGKKGKGVDKKQALDPMVKNLLNGMYIFTMQYKFQVIIITFFIFSDYFRWQVEKEGPRQDDKSKRMKRLNGLIKQKIFKSSKLKKNVIDNKNSSSSEDIEDSDN